MAKAKRGKVEGRKEAPTPTPTVAATPATEGFLGRHLFGTLVLALLAALTITTSLAIAFERPDAPGQAPLFPGGIASPFTTDGFPCEEDELLGYAAPEANPSPDGIACLHIDLLANNTIMDALAFCAAQGGIVAGFDFGGTDKPVCVAGAPCSAMTAVDQARLCDETGTTFIGEAPTAVGASTAIPCAAPTYTACEPKPTPGASSGVIVGLCSDVSALMRSLVRGFSPDGEPPSRSLATKLGRVNEPVCRARSGTELIALCVSTRTAVNEVLDQSAKEPDVMSQAQLAALRSTADLVCEEAEAQR